MNAKIPFLPLFISLIEDNDHIGKLSEGRAIQAKILDAVDGKAVMLWQGQRLVAATQTPLQKGELVTLIYQGTNQQGKPMFRVDNSDNSQVSIENQVVKEVFEQLRVEQTPEMVGKLTEYLSYKLAGRTLKPAIEQFALLAKAKVPLTSIYLRIWHEFWQDDYFKSILAKLCAQKQPSSETDQLTKELIAKLPDVFAGGAHNEVATLVGKFIGQQRQHGSFLDLQLSVLQQQNIHDFEIADQAGETEEAEAAEIKQLLTLTSQAMQHVSANKLLNTAGRSFTELDPLYVQIPLFMPDNVLLIELLIRQVRAESKGSKDPGYQITLAVPTVNLGEIVAIIRLKGQSRSLELLTGKTSTATKLRAGLQDEDVTLPFTNTKITVQKKPLSKLKQLYIDLIKQQTNQAVDFRI